jgi:hypothetical protein
VKAESTFFSDVSKDDPGGLVVQGGGSSTASSGARENWDVTEENPEPRRLKTEDAPPRT